MLISVHVQKTAGTAFRTFAQRNLGDRLGVYYAVDGLDTPALASAAESVVQGESDAAKAALSGSGLKLIHGHKVAPFLDLYPEAPAMIWLREPFSRLVSEFLHLRRAPNPDDEFAAGVRDGAVGLNQLAAKRRTFYARHLETLRQTNRPVLVFLSECAGPAEAAFREALGWRGGLGQVNAAPARDAEASAALEREHDDLRRTDLADERRLFKDALDSWKSGEAARQAIDVLGRTGLQRSSSFSSVARAELTRIKDLFRRLRA